MIHVPSKHINKFMRVGRDGKDTIDAFNGGLRTMWIEIGNILLLV